MSDCVSKPLPDPFSGPLAERWIVARYLRLLHRSLRAARADTRGSWPLVQEQLTVGIERDIPDTLSAPEAQIRAYLTATARTIIDARSLCDAAFDLEERPFALINTNQPGAARVVAPGCSRAYSLLDAVHNLPPLLTNWCSAFWCVPRVLFQGLRDHERHHESGRSRFTGYLTPVDRFAPAQW